MLKVSNRIPLNLINVLYQQLGYTLYGGCVKGSQCSDGLICGTNEVCRSCSFDECMEHAIANNYVAFSYSGVLSQWCRLCDEADLRSAMTQKDWGTYVTGKYLYSL